MGHVGSKGRESMAKLENLRDFDEEFRLLSAAIEEWDRGMARTHRSWTPQQRDQLEILIRAITHTYNAISHLVHNNR
jgi:hypothetical protein